MHLYPFLVFPVESHEKSLPSPPPSLPSPRLHCAVAETWEIIMVIDDWLHFPDVRAFNFQFPAARNSDPAYERLSSISCEGNCGAVKWAKKTLALSGARSSSCYCSDRQAVLVHCFCASCNGKAVNYRTQVSHLHSSAFFDMQTTAVQLESEREASDFTEHPGLHIDSTEGR